MVYVDFILLPFGLLLSQMSKKKRKKKVECMVAHICISSTREAKVGRFHEFKTRLDYIVHYRLAWATMWSCSSRGKEGKGKEGKGRGEKGREGEGKGREEKGKKKDSLCWIWANVPRKDSALAHSRTNLRDPGNTMTQWLFGLQIKEFWKRKVFQKTLSPRISWHSG